MKKKLLFSILPLFSLVSCGASNVAHAELIRENGLLTIKINGSEHVTYLLLSPFGSIENYEGISTKGEVSELFYENCVTLKADAGTLLPDATQVKTTVEGASFRCWAYYDESNENVWPEYYDKVQNANGLALKAIFDGTATSEGGGSTPIEPVSDITWTAENMPTWVTDDGCIIFAWAWQDGVEGKWYTLTYTSETSATFEAPSNIVGMLLARCAPNTVTPDWDIKVDGPGRVYNQTENVNVQKGVTSYSFPDSLWKEYK